MMPTKALALIFIIIFISFLGFITENLFICFRSGFIDNRNMIFPFLLGYGLAVFSIYKLFGTPDFPLFWGKELNIESKVLSFAYYYLIAFLCVSVGEVILGFAMEWTCNIKWWDYSDLPLHITQYTSVPTSMVFAFLITIFMKYLFNPLLNIFSSLNPQFLSIVAISALVLLSIDFIHSAIYMFKNHQTLNLWRIEFKRSLKEILTNMKGSH